MPLPRDYGKELDKALSDFRAKCSELNLLNSEVLAVDRERGARYDALKRHQEEYNSWHNDNVIAKAAPLTECRSELQAMQAMMLDLLIEMNLRG
jgi:hypothetical protein